MVSWRLLKLETHDAFMNMALDEAIVNARTKDLVPNTIRFYQWEPSAVSVGRFQDILNEVQVENCRQKGVDIVRRNSGGGTVYHDRQGEITYSVIAKEEDFGTADVIQAYNAICNGLIEAARNLGVKADFNKGDPKNCPNIAIEGKKISGSAQSHKGGVLLQHGTFLIEVDLERMFTFLRVPWAKALKDVVCVAQGKHTSVKDTLGRNVSAREAYEALVTGFQKAFEARLDEGTLIAYEKEAAKKLHEHKFSTNDWNLKGISKAEY